MKIMMLSDIGKQNKNKQIVEVKKVTKKKDKKKIEKELILIEKGLMEENIIADIMKTLQKPCIVIESKVANKFQCMMRSQNEKLEVYGKMIVEVEEFLGIKYLCVKDVLIPYQTVTSASFISPPEQLGKWINELSHGKKANNEDFEEITSGLKVAPIKSVNNITKKMVGHFHSHDSVGGAGYSRRDTEDVLLHVQNKDYWIEIIGTKKEYRGRIALVKPINLLIECDVIIKWWEHADEILDELNNKIYKEEYKYSYKNKKQKRSDERWKDDDLIYFMGRWVTVKEYDEITKDDEYDDYLFDKWWY